MTTENSTTSLVHVAILNPQYNELILKLKSLHRNHLNANMTFKQCLSLYAQEGIAFGQFRDNLELLDVPENIVNSWIGVEAEYVNGDWIVEGENYNNSIKYISITKLY